MESNDAGNTILSQSMVVITMSYMDLEYNGMK